MNLTSILFEPYVITIFIALIITGIVYLVLKSDKKDDDEDQSISKTLFYTFIITYISLVLFNFLLKYMDSQKYFQKGGEVTFSDRLTLVADDVDVGMIE